MIDCFPVNIQKLNTFKKNWSNLTYTKLNIMLLFILPKFKLFY